MRPISIKEVTARIGLTKKLVCFTYCGLSLIGLGACALPRLDAVPEQATTFAQVTDIPNSRYYLDAEGSAAINREAFAAVEREKVILASRGIRSPPPAYFLALSGGGENGAFGAGLLAGWTKNGTRPRFNLVTGVSAGALIAPFAFLGPEYDPMLRRMFTDTTPSDIYFLRTLFSIVGQDGVADSGPLLQTILSYLDEGVVARIAEAYKEGRLLFIATTNLDAARPVIWNIGAIAASGSTQARETIAKVLLASASVPGLFPPVFFEAEYAGRHYQEMHVDGGTVANTFLYPPTWSARVSKRRYVAYIIRNGSINDGWQNVKRQTLAIAGRAVSTLSSSNTASDIDRIYATTKRDGVEFNLAYVKSDFQNKSNGAFDLDYTASLVDYGFQRGSQGYPWDKRPPSLPVDVPGAFERKQRVSFR